MIVHNLYIFRACLCPDEADPVLIIDPDRVLPCPISTKRFETISRWAPQIIECMCRMKHGQLAARHSLNLMKTPRSFSIE